MIAEHYNQVIRALDDGQTVRLRVVVDSRFTTDDDRDVYITIAEITGAGSKSREVVMSGVNMDSWHTWTGRAYPHTQLAVSVEGGAPTKKPRAQHTHTPSLTP